MMKKNIFLLGLALLAYGFLFTQNVFASGGSDGFSKSQNSLQEFKRRYNEIVESIF
jgi:peptidoglycan hydrolase CwlO-like protein